MLNRPPGCPFAARCPRAEPACRESVPALREIAAGHQAACHLLSEGGEGKVFFF